MLFLDLKEDYMNFFSIFHPAFFGENNSWKSSFWHRLLWESVIIVTFEHKNNLQKKLNRKIIKEYKRLRILVACQAFGKELSENVNQTPNSQATQGGARHGERGRLRGEREQNNKVFRVISNITVVTDDCRIFLERTADAERIYNTVSQQIPT